MVLSVHQKYLCPPPIEISYGNVKVAIQNSSSISVYTCNEGYIIHGNKSVNCDLENNRWPLAAIPECGECIFP